MNFFRKSAAQLLQRIGLLASTRPLRMETEDNFLYYSHEKLLGLIAKAKDKNEAIKDYISNVNYAPIKDFDKGLEWFNVSEPLSFAKHLKGKIVILDFFTYCCINCMHILPDLKAIEKKFSIEDGVVVIGVHSAKFDNEKLSSNILSAVQRYNIDHPVVNDCNSEMWRTCDVHCWPTLLMLGPDAKPIVMLTGEGHKDELMDYIKVALDFYRDKKQISAHSLPLKSAFHFLPNVKGPPLFPGKIASYTDENKRLTLAISDTGNNRILVTDENGTILRIIGGRRLGFKDGSLVDAEFNNPQGLTFLDENTIFVADTENHAIRRIDLENDEVVTVAGTGEQGHDRLGGKPGKDQAISSPWDVCVYKTPDMDLSFYADGKPPVRNVLIIAMAGTHQIWALFLDDTVWWKCKKYSKGTCINIAGSGREENRNNSYPHAAAFAQPSGLALCHKSKDVYIADSESSSVRRLSLVDGKVTPVVGGDRNPNNLFAFGDKDGTLYEAKLQHLLGLTMSPDERTLFVADTYNHKIKKVDTLENRIETLQFETPTNATDFNEPAGLCMSSDGKRIFLADTNNHQVKVLHVGKGRAVSSVDLFELRTTENDPQPKTETIPSTVIPLKDALKVSSKGGKLVLKVNLNYIDGLKLTPDAPQKWVAHLPNVLFGCKPTTGTDMKNVDIVLNVPPHSAPGNLNLDVAFQLITCTDETCLPKVFALRIPLYISEKGSSAVEKVIDISLGLNSVDIA